MNQLWIVNIKKIILKVKETYFKVVFSTKFTTYILPKEIYVA